MSDVANADPTKQFFIEMLTRDISLEDAILDLLDNCIDSLSRTRNLPLSEALLDQKAVKKASDAFKENGLPKVDVRIDENSFSIEDNCGGISYKSAKEDVFRFGMVANQKKARLSVYGIGLKRAMFKLGKEISIESKTVADGFIVNIDVDDWSSNDKWNFVLDHAYPARSREIAGTKITVQKLNREVKLRLRDGQLIPRLSELVSTAYSLLLGRFFIVRLNGDRIHSQRIPIGHSASVTSARDQFDVDNVRVTLLAGLAERVNEEWRTEGAGWYVLCNGRVVIFADKTDLTGWGAGSADYVSKYRGFVGIAFFFSENPEALPWTTTKRGLNRESPSYLRARNKMSLLSRPVLSFLNKMYASGEPEELTERQIANTVKAGNIIEMLRISGKSFAVKRRAKASKSSTVSIQYKASINDVERIKKHIRKTRWSASRIGQRTFDYFVEHELP